jgi:hypothetical protein
MAALTHGTQRNQLSDLTVESAPQKGGTIIYQGAAVMLDASGLALPAAAGTAGAYCFGVAVPQQNDLSLSDATGLADGKLTVFVRTGAFGFANDGTNPILSTTQPGTIVYAKDDNTASLSNTGTRPALGRLIKLDPTSSSGPVIVEMGKTVGKVATVGAIASLVDNSGGSASGTIAAITGTANAGSADLAPVKNAIASLAAKVDAILAALQ